MATVVVILVVLFGLCGLTSVSGNSIYEKETIFAPPATAVFTGDNAAYFHGAGTNDLAALVKDDQYIRVNSYSGTPWIGTLSYNLTIPENATIDKVQVIVYGCVHTYPDVSMGNFTLNFCYQMSMWHQASKQFHVGEKAQWYYYDVTDQLAWTPTICNSDQLGVRVDSFGITVGTPTLIMYDTYIDYLGISVTWHIGTNETGNNTGTGGQINEHTVLMWIIASIFFLMALAVLVLARPFSLPVRIILFVILVILGVVFSGWIHVPGVSLCV
jgi:hypothetical protein